MLDGEPVVIGSPQQAVRLGIGYVPEDRKLQGLFQGMTIRDNIAMSVIGPDDARRFRRPRGRDGVADRLPRPTPGSTARHRGAGRPALSGGNQQKVALAKWLALAPRCSSSTSPRGASTWAPRPRSMPSSMSSPHEGIGIILISSELPEVLNMSDRILVVADGEIVGELAREEATQERVLELSSIKSSRAAHAATASVGTWPTAQ